MLYGRRPAHELGHTLDFIISYGFSVTLRYQIITFFILLFPDLLAGPFPQLSDIGPSVAKTFSAAFKDSSLNANSGPLSLLWTDAPCLYIYFLCNVGLCCYSLSGFPGLLTSPSGNNTVGDQHCQLCFHFPCRLVILLQVARRVSFRDADWSTCSLPSAISRLFKDGVIYY